MKINVTMTIETPRVPNFLKTASGETIPVCAVDDDGLRAIAAQWLSDLLERAKVQHYETYGKDRVQS